MATAARGAVSPGLEVHPDAAVTTSTGGSSARWCAVLRLELPAATSSVGVGSYEPRDHVKQPTVALADASAAGVRYRATGSAPASARGAGGRVLCGDSAGHCFPLSGVGIRTALYFGIACGRELGEGLSGRRTRDEALRRYAAFSAGHARAFGLALRLQGLVPRLPPRLLTAGLKAFGRGPLVRRSSLVPRAGAGELRDGAAGAQSRTPSHSLP